MTSALSAAVARGCPTPGKVAFPDKTAALAALDLALRMRHKGVGRPRHGHGVERRVYRCPCGLWHLTSRAKKKW